MLSSFVDEHPTRQKRCTWISTRFVIVLVSSSVPFFSAIKCEIYQSQVVLDRTSEDAVAATATASSDSTPVMVETTPKHFCRTR